MNAKGYRLLANRIVKGFAAFHKWEKIHRLLEDKIASGRCGAGVITKSK